MTEPILCVVAAFLLAWVFYLKKEITSLQQKLDKLSGHLKRQLKEQTGDVEITTIQRGWGKKVNVEEVDTSWVKNPGGSAGRPGKGG